MNTPTIMPDVPDCGAACAICEAHAHVAAKLRQENDKLRAALTDIQFAGSAGYARNRATKALEETL